MTALINPASPEYADACAAASAILKTKVRYVAEYAHGAHSIGLVLKRGNGIEVALRRKENKFGVTGGYLRAMEHGPEALLREWHEEESPNGLIPVTIEDLFRYGRFIGLVDTTGHTVANHAQLREWTILILLDLPADRDIVFTPTPETSEKRVLSYTELLKIPHLFRGDGEYQPILRAAFAVQKQQEKDLLPRLTQDPLAAGVYLNIVDASNVVL